VSEGELGVMGAEVYGYAPPWSLPPPQLGSGPAGEPGALVAYARSICRAGPPRAPEARAPPPTRQAPGTMRLAAEEDPLHSGAS
jgi:hypothetical protein